MEHTRLKASSSDGEDASESRSSFILGLSSVARNPFIWNSVQLFVLGTLVETGRMLCQWLMERFQFQYHISAEFAQGDPSYEWVIALLNEEHVWRRAREFHVNEKSTKRKWGIRLGMEVEGNAEYVPMYTEPQVFRWRGYWIEVRRTQERGEDDLSMLFNFRARARWVGRSNSPSGTSTLYISIYTLDMNVLSNFVEDARARYKKLSKPNVTVHMATNSHHHRVVWNDVKHKARRPLSSIVLTEGVVESLVEDAQEFMGSEKWYVDVGIPHRRGYLLYGPPGTGKTSTIYALASELGLEIYTLSLSSEFVDDSYLQKAAASIPKNSIFLIEDIDCAFPSRDDDENNEQPTNMLPNLHSTVSIASAIHIAHTIASKKPKSLVTLSGLLNVLDGVGSEEGKLFFATTNYIERLDPALLRPGRVDTKIQYRLATTAQASALFRRFFVRFPRVPSSSKPDVEERYSELIAEFAARFATHIPEHEFSIAELQGFLLCWKKEPERAVSGVAEWVARELEERRAQGARISSGKSVRHFC